MQTLDITKEKPLGWCVVGLGKFATEQMMPNFKNCKHSKLVAFVSSDKKKTQGYCEQYNVSPDNVYTYDEMDKIKDNKEIDIVYVITPVGLHAEHTIKAAKAGKHVLCEKPMARTVEECQQMIDACKENNVKLMIAYRCQYEPYNQAAIKKIRDGELGKVRYITADHGRMIEPDQGSTEKQRVDIELAGGGSLMDIGIYSLNACRYLTGEEPIEVIAMESTDKSDKRFKEVEDNIHFVLRFPSGILGNCTSSYSIEGVKRYRVFGDKGWLNLDPATEYSYHKLVVGDSKKQTEYIIEEENHFAAEMDHFSECVKNNKTPRTPGEEGLKDVKYILAVYLSAKEGRAIKLQ